MLRRFQVVCFYENLLEHMWAEVTSDWSRHIRLTSAHVDALSDPEHQNLSADDGERAASWWSGCDHCHSHHHSAPDIIHFTDVKIEPIVKRPFFLLTLILNQILIHILYWLGLHSEIDQLIILQNKRAGESKHPSRATSSPLRRRSSYYNQTLLKHTHCPHMWTPSTHTHTHTYTTLRSSIWSVFIHLTGELTATSWESNMTRRYVFYVSV